MANLLYHVGIDPDGYNFVMQGEIEKFIGEIRNVLVAESNIGPRIESE